MAATGTALFVIACASTVGAAVPPADDIRGSTSIVVTEPPPSAVELPVCVFPAERAGPDQAARAVATAMLINDRTIGGFSATYRTITWRPGRGEWTQLAAADEVSDECGRWFRVQQHAFADPQTGKSGLLGGTRSFDGHEVRSREDAGVGDSAIIEQEDPYKTAWPVCSPARLLGRQISYNARKLLGDMLLQSEDLAIVPDAREGHIRVRATIDADNWVAIVEVDADQAHGFAPDRICTFDSLSGEPAELLMVDEFQNIGGAWVPTRGTRRSFEEAEQAPDLEQTFHESLSAAGITGRVDPRDAARRRQFQGILRAAFGPNGRRVRQVRDFSPEQVEDVHMRKIGIGCGEPLPIVEFREGVRVVDTLRHLGADGKPLEDPDQMKTVGPKQ